MSKFASSRRTQVIYGDNLHGEIQINDENMCLFLYEIKPGSKPGNRKNQIVQFHHISSCTSFTVDPINLQIKFYGINDGDTFDFKFIEEVDLSNFIQRISNHIMIMESDVSPCHYLLGSIDFGESQFNSTFLPKLNNRFEISKYDKIDEILKQTINNDNEIMEINDDNSDFYNKNWNEKIIFKAFQLRYKKSNDILSYEDISKQWKLLNNDQIKIQIKIQGIINKIEKDILQSDNYFKKFHEEETKKKIQKIAFNVMLSYTYYNYDGASYYSREIDLLIPLLDAYISQYGTDCDSDKCEANLFYLYDSFYRYGVFNELKVFKKQSFIKPMIIKLGHQLIDKFPEIIKFLESKNITSLDFFVNDISRWFIGSFCMKDIHRLWLSIPQFQSLDRFFSCFITSLLISITQEMKNYYPINQKEFLKFYQQVIPKIQMKDLLYHAKIVETKLFPEQQSC